MNRLIAALVIALNDPDTFGRAYHIGDEEAPPEDVISLEFEGQRYYLTVELDVDD